MVEVLRFLAHAGHDHDEAATAPWWTDEVALDSVLTVTFIALLFVAIYVFKWKPGSVLSLVMAYLLVVGLTVYQVSPALSIISLTLGMALALITTFMQLSKKD